MAKKSESTQDNLPPRGARKDAAMRNDARPIGPQTDQQSPLSESHSRDVVNREERATGRSTTSEPETDADADGRRDSDTAVERRAR
jgi:hypothetical protein